MKIELMSILVNSSINFEFPYQLMFVCEERLNDVFDHRNGKYNGWTLTLNLCHNDDETSIKWIGPETKKESKTLLITIFVGNIIGNDVKEITLEFISAMFTSMPEILNHFEIPHSNEFESKKNELLSDVTKNFNKYLKENEWEIDLDEIDLD